MDEFEYPNRGLKLWYNPIFEYNEVIFQLAKQIFFAKSIATLNYEGYSGV